MFKHISIVSKHVFNEVVEENKTFIAKQLQSLYQQIKADLLYVASVQQDAEEAMTLVALDKGKQVDNFTYPLANSPCEDVVGQKICSLNAGAQLQYPNDIALRELGVEGYIGEPILNSDGDVMGILVGLYKQPQTDLSGYHFSFSLLCTYLSEYVERVYFSSKLSSQLSLHTKVEDISRIGAWEYDVQQDSLFWSDGAYAIHGLSSKEPIALEKAISFYTQDSRKTIEMAVAKAIEHAKSYRCELDIVDSFGKQKRIRTNGEPETNDNGDVVRLYGAIEDVTEQQKLFNNLHHNNARLTRILDNLNDGVITINSDGIIENTNAIACAMFGYTGQELIGMNINLLMPEPYSSSHTAYMRHYQETGEAKIMGIGRQLPGRRKNGDVFQMELSLTQSEKEGDVEYIGIVRDISERLQAQDTIYNLAYIDDISGLKNKKWFEKELRDLLLRAQMESHNICIALMDIDNMAQFNLKHGFDSGNDAIKQIATKLLTHSSDTLKVYKNGADSFVLLSMQTLSDNETTEYKDLWLDRGFLDKENFIVDVGGVDLPLSASIGSCIFDAQTHSFESVLDTLEHTVKQAKKHKPFGYYVIDDDGVHAYERVKKITNALDSVTESGELSIALQPQFNADAKIPSSEALIRWHSAELGFVSPADFIPIAEKSDVILKIGDWVLNQVCELLEHLNNQGKRTRIAVNISAKQIVSTKFKEKLLMLVNKHNIAPEQLMLELTETTLVSDIELVKNVMIDMRKVGFKFSVDDFGTGYSSLNYLKELPISELKIDKHFVDDILLNEVKSGGMIVNLIVDMAKILNVDCVAEGVETIEQVEFLNQRNCSLYQGYYFSKPLPIADWLKLF